MTTEYFILQLSKALGSIDAWQFDSFELEEASIGRPLSCLAFHLMKKMNIVKHFQLDEIKLTRFLMRIEQGYLHNP